MDPWKEMSVWEIRRDEVREWAALEGKSATMSEELYRCRVGPSLFRQGSLRMLSLCAHAGAWVLEAWRFFRSG